MTGNPRLRIVLAAIALMFGIATVISGGRVLTSEDARLAAGAVVPFVLWFNFLAGFAYIAAGFGLWRARPWAPGLAILILISTLAVFAAFGVHVAMGGAYEGRTVGAMSLRSLVWLVIAGVAWRQLLARRSSR